MLKLFVNDFIIKLNYLFMRNIVKKKDFVETIQFNK